MIQIKTSPFWGFTYIFNVFIPNSTSLISPWKLKALMGEGVGVEMFWPREEKFVLVLAWSKETAYGYPIIAIRPKGGNQKVVMFSYWQRNVSTLLRMSHIEKWRQLPWQPVNTYSFTINVHVPQDIGLTFWSLDVSWSLITKQFGHFYDDRYRSAIGKRGKGLTQYGLRFMVLAISKS